MADAARPTFEERELARWQRRLLPFLIGAITLMAIFFFASSVYQLDRLGKSVALPQDSQIERALDSFEKRQATAAPDPAGELEFLRWKTTVLMEKNVLRHRYAQVNATLMLRAWTRHLGFLTGMILALVGAVFILGKLREDQTQLSAEGGGAKGALATSSPGIVLATLGTVLMVVTLTAEFEFTTTDTPVYLGAAAPGEEALPTPPPLADEAARQREETDLFGARSKEGQDALPTPTD